MAHVDDVIIVIVILVIVTVPVFNPMTLFKVGALVMAALIGGVRLARVGQLFIATLVCWRGLAPRFPPDEYSCPEQKYQHNGGGDEQGCLGMPGRRLCLTGSKDALICSVLAVTALLGISGI